jgi:predicted nucleic acid-binding protein
MELIQDAQNSHQVRRALKLVAPLPIVWPTEVDCDHALSNFTAYHLSHNLGLIDSLIGACAVGLSATLCTFNVKHYKVVLASRWSNHIVDSHQRDQRHRLWKRLQPR